MTMKEYQVTLVNPSNTYKPVSCIIKYPQDSNEDLSALDSNVRKFLQNEGIKKICMKRLWGKSELIRFGYTRVKIRVYDKEQIKIQNEKRYEMIKEAKYESGEWKRPQKKEEV